MNNRRKTSHGKMRRGIKRRTKPFRWRLKKVRGKNNRKNTAVKVHSVSTDGILISTSFATYLLPRNYFITLSKAKQLEIQNVKGFLTHTYQYSVAGNYVLSFYWHALDDIYDVVQFEKFKVSEICKTLVHRGKEYPAFIGIRCYSDVGRTAGGCNTC